jgi:glycine cleavage system transcriptional repressor
MNVIITAVGAKDRPGIIAGLTAAVYEAGGNLDDATMTRLRGAFANMLAASLPDDEAVAGLKARLAAISQPLGLRVMVYEMPEDDDDADDEADHTISVYGADRPGIVHAISSALAEGGANIVSLDNRVAGTMDRPVYVMLLETSGGDWNRVPELLASISKKIGVDVSHHKIDSEAL